MKLVFLRHGESMGNVWHGAYMDDRTNFLSIRGVKQAELAAYDIEELLGRVDEVICSEATRARQTATTVMQSMGDWQRHYIQDARLNEWGLEADASVWPGEETEEQFHAKVTEFFEEVIVPRWNSKTNWLIVSHHFTMSVLFENIRRFRGEDVNLPPLMDRLMERKESIPNAVPFYLDTFSNDDLAPIFSGYKAVRR